MFRGQHALLSRCLAHKGGFEKVLGSSLKLVMHRVISGRLLRLTSHNAQDDACKILCDIRFYYDDPLMIAVIKENYCSDCFSALLYKSPFMALLGKW